MATTLYTIGFTKSSAEHFFGRLQQVGIRRLVDIRLNNTSTLAGFTKKDDLAFFLRSILDISYVHEPLLAPTDEMLRRYREKGMAWDDYAAEFRVLLAERDVTSRLDRAGFDTPNVLLCSEATAEHCHRRLVAEYLAQIWGDVEIVHL